MDFNLFRAKLLATRKAVNLLNGSSRRGGGEGRRMMFKLWFAERFGGTQVVLLTTK
jgi:hypothetical protein